MVKVILLSAEDSMTDAPSTAMSFWSATALNQAGPESVTAASSPHAGAAPIRTSAPAARMVFIVISLRLNGAFRAVPFAVAQRHEQQDADQFLTRRLLLR